MKRNLAVTIAILTLLLAPASFGRGADFKLVRHLVKLDHHSPSQLVTFALPDDLDPNGEAYILFTVGGKTNPFHDARMYINPPFPTSENPECYFGSSNPNLEQALGFKGNFSGGREIRHFIDQHTRLKPGVNRVLFCLENAAEQPDAFYFLDMVVHFHRQAN